MGGLLIWKLIIYLRNLKNINKIFLYLLFFLLPVDYLSLTAQYLREFGSRPASIVLLLLFIYTLLSYKLARKISNYLPVIFFIIYVSISYIFYRILFYDDNIYYQKNSIFQFISHTLLFGLAITLVSGLRYNNKIFLFKPYYPIIFAATIHLFTFFLDYLDLTKDIINQALLHNFRMWGQVNEKSSGFMAEASTYGVFGVIYSALTFEVGRYFFGFRKIIIYILSAVILSTTIIIQAKTGLIVLLIIWIVLYSKKRVSLLALPVIGLIAFYYIDKHAMFDLNNNLSSAMRIGSTMVALNAFIETNWLIGIGPGQFHFEYLLSRFPEFLFSSQEAIAQSSPDTFYRASTYSLLFRLLLEIGIVGTIISIYSVYRIYIRKPIGIAEQNNRLFKIIFLGSLAFLLSQDTYFYPMFIFSLSGILATSIKKI